jgi:glycosyltransferase involved in cell wall biosynthesis
VEQPTGARGAVLVAATATAGQQGPVAALVSTAGWAAGAQRVLGASWIATPSGVIDPSAARRRGSAAELAAPPSAGWKQHLPTVAKTAIKDLRQARRGRRFRVPAAGPWSGHEVAFVWQRHELFHTAGLDLADELGVASVLFVPATAVWESARWGVRRPGWAGLAERWGEAPSLRRATLVAAGSEEVAEQVVRLGAEERRVLVTPTGVDLDLFPPDLDGRTVRDRLGLGDRFVVGWAGSFRRFHSLDLAVEAVAQVDGAVLLLVGDGPERATIEQLARSRRVDVITTGTVAHPDLPAHLAAFDIALVQAAAGAGFHYSPLKLAEYLAAGRAVIAPDVPALAERFVDGTELVLVPPGDVEGLATALRSLRDDPTRRAELGAAGRTAIERDGTWEHQVARIVDRLDELAP